MPNLRTMVTEVGTGLGMLGMNDLDEVLRARPSVMRSLSPETWDQLAAVRAGAAFDVEFHAAWENGRAFLQANDGLRGRLPQAVEWKGSLRASGDEVTPVDLRIDHVYLVSCKYLSNILFNVAPSHVFDALLVGGTGRGGGAGGDWYAAVAPAQYQALYEAVRDGLLLEGSGEVGTGVALRREDANGERGSSPSLFGPDGDRREAVVAAHSVTALRELPPQAIDLSSEQRGALSSRLKSGWPAQAKEAYRSLSEQVAQQSAAADGLGTRRRGWRGNAVALTSDGQRALFRAGFERHPVAAIAYRHAVGLAPAIRAPSRFEVFPQAGGQPRVGWQAVVRDRSSGEVSEVAGHIEIRWSHGRFGGFPEAKGYLDTRHQLVPGYIPLR